MEVIVMDEMNAGDMGFMGDMGDVEGMEYMDEIVSGTQQVPLTDRLMSSWFFVGGVAAGILAIGVLFGLLSAKGKKKKGIDLYED